MLYGCTNGKEAKHFFASKTQIFHLQNMLLGYANEETSGDIQSQCFFSVSHVIPLLLPHATYVEDTKSVSWKEKMLFKFSKNIFCVLDAFLVPQQCFLVCAGLSVVMKVTSEKKGIFSFYSHNMNKNFQ